MNIVVLGAGTAGLIASLIIREKYPNDNITIVKSGEIGIVGVGEGSTEHWAEFMSFVGLDRVELIHETKATVKIGILFKDWNIGSEYVHSIGPFNLSGIGRPDIFNHLHLNGKGKFPLSPGFEHIFYKNYVPITENFNVSNQFHFDTFKLNEYLTKVCSQRGITFIDATVDDIIQDTTGDVTSLVTSTGQIPGDLFIDCSGFRRVISGKLGTKWESKSKYLPMNRAIAFPTGFDTPGEIEPYTTSTALSSGWSWKIPTQERYGNGYVFNDEYISTDEALNEISQSLNVEVEKYARDIKFDGGKVDKFWNKNVVCVGLASSFAEPLEAQSIGFTIIQSMTLISYLDSWKYNKKISEKYNEDMDTVFDNIVDYLQLHYITDRKDTKFWRERPFEYTDFLKDNLFQFTQGIIDPGLFKHSRLMFNIANFYQVLAGNNLINKNSLTKLFESNRQQYNDIQQKNADESVQRTENRFVIKHSDYLRLINENFLYKNNLNEN